MIVASTAQAISARTRARMSTPPYDHTTAPAPDNRPTRLDVDALLLGSAALTAKVRRDVVDALEGAGLLNGSKGHAPTDAFGRLSITEVDRAIARFEESIRVEVKSILSAVGALAPSTDL